MKVLHLFRNYLPHSEMWAFNLLRHLENTSNYIGALYYSASSEMRPSSFTFLERRNSKLLLRLFQEEAITSAFLRKIYLQWWKLNRSDITDILKGINTYKPNLIHFHFATTAILFKEVWKKSGLPFIVSFYGYDYEKVIYDSPELLSEYRLVFSFARYVLVEGVHGKEALIKLGCEESKIKIIKLGVNINSRNYNQKSKSHGLQLIQIANFLEKKGQEEVVNAFSLRSKDWGDKVHCTFVGDHNTPYGAKVKAMIKDQGLKNCFTFVDFISYDKIGSYLVDFDVFIHPSKYAEDRDCEGGAPTILLDAQASGLPVISTTHCDIPSYVLHKTSGILTKESDHEELARSVDHFLKMEKEEYTEFSRNAIDHVKRNYDIKTNAISLEELYQTIYFEKSNPN